jgi:hypothetical protein
MWAGQLSQYSDRLRTGRPGFDPWQAEDFSSALCPKPALGPAQPPVQWAPGVLCPGVKRGWGRDADLSPPSCTEVKKEMGYTSSSPKRLHGV